MGVTGLGNSDWGKFGCCVGMPLSPPAIPKVPLKMPVVLWGDWSSHRSRWTTVVYADGSGMAP
eukprot:997332-Pyramimonas_sp.AAC.1